MLLKTVFYSSIADLENIIDPWDALAKNALEQSINYESTPLLSLLNNISYPNWCVLTIWSDELLVGFFPMQEIQTYKIPIKQYTTLFENHFMSCTPLIHADHADDVVSSYLNWINADSAKLFHINEIVDGSAYGVLLHKKLVEAGLVVSLIQSSDRAAVTDTAQSYAEYYSSNFNVKNRNTLKRKRKQLSALGNYKVKICIDDPSLAETMLDDLIVVEAKSWKSQQGTAIALHPELRRFMRDTALFAARSKRLLLAVAYVNDKPVAGQYCLINDKRLLCYKLGYDDAFGRYSPGQLLMLNIVEHCLNSNEFLFIDSCAEADAVMFNRSLRQRVHFSKYRIASNHFASSLFLRCIQMLKKFRR